MVGGLLNAEVKMPANCLNERKRLEREGKPNSGTNLKLRRAAQRIAVIVIDAYSSREKLHTDFHSFIFLSRNFNIDYEKDGVVRLNGPLMTGGTGIIPLQHGYVIYESSWKNRIQIELPAARFFARNIAEGWLQELAADIARHEGADLSQKFKQTLGM